GNQARLHFRHVDGLLESLELVPTHESKDKNGRGRGAAWRVRPGSGGAPLTGFTIAGADRKFYNAEAKIEGDHVLVWSEQVPQPVAVRYGWANYPLGNLFNKDARPASPFRTDQFPVVTQPRP
ncbi:MAG: acetyl esterase, partial [Planctomycetes bacterium]|nr:acetyl esterase [Planctomycetota bacterium]